VGAGKEKKEMHISIAKRPSPSAEEKTSRRGGGIPHSGGEARTENGKQFSFYKPGIVKKRRTKEDGQKSGQVGARVREGRGTSRGGREKPYKRGGPPLQSHDVTSVLR